MVSSARASPSTSTVHTELNASYMSCIHQGPSINNVHGEGEGGHADKLREACMNFQYIPFAHQGKILAYNDCGKTQDAGLVERVVEMVERV